MSYQQLVEQHNRLTYRDNVRMVAQQTQDPLRSAVTIVPGAGESMNVAQFLGKKDAQRIPDRSRFNVDDPTPRSARWLVRPEMIRTGEYLDTVTKWDAAMDPTSPLFRNNIQAVQRGVFDSILGIERRSDGTFAIGQSGIMGNARSGKRGETVTGLPAGQIIAHGSTGLTMTKLRDVKERLNKADFGLETMDPMYALITPAQVDDLLGIAVATGSALNLFDIEQIKSGKPSPLLGITWIVSNRVPTTAAGVRQVPFWTKQNVIAAFWQDVEGDIWNDTHADNTPYMRASAAVDAVRGEDAGVFIVECSE